MCIRDRISVGCLQLWYLIFIFIHVVTQLSFSYYLIMLFSYLLSVVYLVIILCTLFICTSSPLYTHTLTRSLSDDPGFARPDIGRFVSIVQVFEETARFAKSWSFSLFDSGNLICLHIISWFSLYQIHLLFQFFIPMLSCVDAYMYYCSGRWLIIVWIYNLFRVT